jgi:16S rRNA (cytosine967-C5)-methyltransferase
VIETSTPLRQFIFETLLPLEKGRNQRVHVEDQLNFGYTTHHFSPEDRRFGTFLAYGTLRHWFRLSAIIKDLSTLPIEKLTPPVRLLLRLGFFQLSCMDTVPDYAAVNATMEMATTLKFSQKTRGYVHALLQNYIRQGKPWPDTVEAQLPEWWLKHFKAQYDTEAMTRIATALAQVPKLSLRVNTLKTTVKDYHHELTAAEIAFESSEDIPEILWLTAPQGDPRSLPGYEAGEFLIQDESSARVARFLNPKPGETLLEIGAAPGTKTTHLAALMQNTGRILAVDSSEKRMAKLLENCERLGVTIAESHVMQGQSLTPDEFQADKVLLDAPCSGTGTVGKHPEILLVLREKDLSSYVDIQRTLLAQGFSCLKQGGTMVYSTCSIEQKENQDVIKHFLETHPLDASVEEEITILPDARHDGFYMARLRKTPD